MVYTLPKGMTVQALFVTDFSIPGVSNNFGYGMEVAPEYE
jgi:hypothetical protein